MATAVTKPLNIHELYGHLEDPANHPVPRARRRRWAFGLRVEERFAALVAAGGLIWAATLVGQSLSFHFLLWAPAPLKIAALGALLWLHAKWRRSVAA